MSRPRVALVFPGRIAPDSFFGFCLPSLALERLGAAVEDIAEVRLFDQRFEPDLLGAVTRFQPDTIALNVKTTMYAQEACITGRKLHQLLPSAKIVAGGLHATTSPLEAIEHAHLVIRGDGEIPFRKLIEGESFNEIPGLLWREGSGEIHENPLPFPSLTLDGLRPPARHLRPAHYRYSAAGVIPMDLLETSRGCTHACSFCSSGSVHPARYRVHSPSYVIAEVQRIAARGACYCMLTDDHFGGDPERVEAICDGIIAAGIRIAFFTFIRPFRGQLDLKRKMVKAGFILMSYGAESPDPQQLRRYRKGFDDAAGFVRDVNREWLEAGACYVGNSYVFGDVEETREMLMGLGNYARRLDPTYIEPLYSQPYPGTSYREELKQQDRLLPRPWADFTESRLLVRHPQISEAELARLRARMWVDFFSPRKIAGVFRVPLYFHRVLKLPVPAILKYMHACDYSMFGSVLEVKTHRNFWPAMLRIWFRDAINHFEPQEMDVTENFESFLRMLGLGFLINRQQKRVIQFSVQEKKTRLATLTIRFQDGCLQLARVDGRQNPVDSEFHPGFSIELDDLIRFMTSRSRPRKVFAFLRLALGGFRRWLG